MTSDQARTAEPERLAYLLAAAATILAGMRDDERAHQLTESSLMTALQLGVLRRAPQHTPLENALLTLAASSALLGGWNIAQSSHRPDPQANPAAFLRGVGWFSVTQAAYIALLVNQGARPHRRTLWPRAVIGLGGAALIGWKAPRQLPALGGYGALLALMSTLTADPSVARRAPTLPAGGWLFLTSDTLIILRRLLLRDPTSRAVTEGVMLALYAAAQRQLTDGLHHLSAPSGEPS